MSFSYAVMFEPTPVAIFNLPLPGTTGILTVDGTDIALNSSKILQMSANSVGVSFDGPDLAPWFVDFRSEFIGLTNPIATPLDCYLGTVTNTRPFFQYEYNGGKPIGIGTLTSSTFGPVAAIPLPQTARMLLLGLGAFGPLAARRRRKMRTG